VSPPDGTGADGDDPAMRGQELRELAYELLRKIEHQLGGLNNMADPSIAATVAECEGALAEIKAMIEPKN
jgi:hypothetical protein